MIPVAVIRPDTARTSKGQLSVKNLHAGIVGADHFRSEQNLLRRHIQRLQESGALRHPATHTLTRESDAVPCKAPILLRERATPYRAKICSCRYNGKWSAHLLTITCASRLAPAMLFSIGCGGLPQSVLCRRTHTSNKLLRLP